MPQTIKYSTNPVGNAIKKGNMAIGVNSIDYGDGTWWNTIDVPSGGYVVYANKASNGPSIMVPTDDTSLVSVARSFGASSSVTTAAGARWMRPNTVARMRKVFFMNMMLLFRG